MDDDAIRRFILARRARFVAAAIAGIASAACEPKPAPCLSPPATGTVEPTEAGPPEQPGTRPTSHPTSQPTTPPTTTPTAQPVVPKKDGGVPSPPPQICLSPPFE